MELEDRFKVRAWDKELEQYKEVIGLGTERSLLVSNKWVKNETQIFEQCTGLKDKNGNLIYEGDIIGGIWGGPIIYCNECHSFALGYIWEDGKVDCDACSGDVLWWDVVNSDEPLEVIGNVHDKKLMKELYG